MPNNPMTPELSFAKEKHIYPEIIKHYQESKAKALLEQARINEMFAPDVRELLAKVDDKQTMDELNGFIKVYLSQKFAISVK